LIDSKKGEFSIVNNHSNRASGDTVLRCCRPFIAGSTVICPLLTAIEPIFLHSEYFYAILGPSRTSVFARPSEISGVASEKKRSAVCRIT
jgi:hypothetical protein